MQAMKFSSPAMITGSAALGGLGSKLSGGSFWQGFGIGIAVGAFNHAMEHGIAGGGGGPGDPPTKEELKKGLAIALKEGNISIEVYNTTLNYLDNGNAGVIGSVLWDNKVDIGLTVVGAKWAGAVAKAGGWLKWLNKGQWWRYGESTHKGQKVKRVAWGAHKNHIDKVPTWLQPINKWIRTIKGGHYDIK